MNDVTEQMTSSTRIKKRQCARQQTSGKNLYQCLVWGLEYGSMNFLTPVDGGTWPPSVESVGDSTASSPGMCSVYSPQMTADESGDGMHAPQNYCPTLKIMEQPQEKFRFRYKSEMMGTHGCILGQKSDRLMKTYPTVKLFNYHGKSAVIRCSLVGVVANKNDAVLHAHRLIVRIQDNDREEPQEISVDELCDYTGVFQGMGIVHTAKKHVVDELIKKKRRAFLERIKGLRENDMCLTMREDLQIREEAQAEAKVMNLNIVQLSFEALYEDSTGHLRPICEKVISTPIRNMKCAQTGELKICRIDKHVSSCLGGDDVFILVEKVGKKNIQIRFFELDEEDNEVWEDFGKFTELDVHHQYAVVFRTPRYRDIHIEQPVDVFLQLYRPSDKDTSDPIRFTYKPSEAVGRKRLRTQISETIPTAVVQGFIHKNEMELMQQSNANMGIHPAQHGRFQLPVSSTDNMEDETAYVSMQSDRWPDIERLIEDFNGSENNISWEGLDSLEHGLAMDDVKTYLSKRPSDTLDSDLALDCVAVPARKTVPDQISKKTDTKKGSWSPQVEKKTSYFKKNVRCFPFSMIIVKQIIDLSLNKDILKKILDKTTADGNMILHLLVAHQHPLLLGKFLILIKKYNFTSYINSKNDFSETPLHLAILHNEVDKIRFLIQAGAKPAMRNIKGNNAFHIAVLTNQHSSENSSLSNNDCLDELLNVKNYTAFKFQAQDLNATNEAGLTPLHLAVECGDIEAVKSLLGANCNVNHFDDHGGCSALHMALVSGNIQITQLLLSHSRTNVEYCNRRGISALKLVNVIKGENFEVLSKLLRTKLNISEDEMAVKLETESGDEDCEDDDCVPRQLSTEDGDVQKKKDEPADVSVEAEGSKDFALSSRVAEETINRISDMLDSSGKWKELARGLDLEFLVSAIQDQTSPSRTLLSYADVNGGISTKILDVLECIGEEGAVIEVRKIILHEK